MLTRDTAALCLVSPGGGSTSPGAQSRFLRSGPSWAAFPVWGGHLWVKADPRGWIRCFREHLVPFASLVSLVHLAASCVFPHCRSGSLLCHFSGSRTTFGSVRVRFPCPVRGRVFVVDLGVVGSVGFLGSWGCSAVAFSLWWWGLVGLSASPSGSCRGVACSASPWGSCRGLGDLTVGGCDLLGPGQDHAGPPPPPNSCLVSGLLAARGLRDVSSRTVRRFLPGLLVMSGGALGGWVCSGSRWTLRTRCAPWWTWSTSDTSPGPGCTRFPLGGRLTWVDQRLVPGPRSSSWGAPPPG